VMLMFVCCGVGGVGVAIVVVHVGVDVVFVVW